MQVVVRDTDETWLEAADAADVLRWAADRFAPRLAFAFGFGPEGACSSTSSAALTSTWTCSRSTHGPPVPRDANAVEPSRAALRASRSVRSAPSRPWRPRRDARRGVVERAPDRCCDLRKVQPLARPCAATKPGSAPSGASRRRPRRRPRARARRVPRPGEDQPSPTGPRAGLGPPHDPRRAREHAPRARLSQRGLHSPAPAASRRAARRARRRAGRAKTECGIHADH